jgi:hypothetical protein
MWTTFYIAKKYFICPSNEQPTPERYDCEDHESTVAIGRIEHHLAIFFDEINNLIARAKYGFLSPDNFEYAALHQKTTASELLSENIIRTHAAYSIYCLDATLASLFEDDPYRAILMHGYAVTGVERCGEYARQQDPDGAQQRIARSHIGRMRANLRHKETRELEAEVISYWKAMIDPTLSNEKAAILLKKVFPLTPRTLSAYVAKAKREIMVQSTG